MLVKTEVLVNVPVADNCTSTEGIERQGFDLDAQGTFIQLKVELRSVPGGTADKSDSPVLEKITILSDKEIVE